MIKKALISILLMFGFLVGCGGSDQDTDAGNRKGKSRLSFDVQESDVEPMKHFGDTRKLEWVHASEDGSQAEFSLTD